MGILWGVLYLGLFLTITSAENPEDKLTLDAKQTLVDELGQDGLDKIKEVVPLHRQDLDSNYVAYFAVIYETYYYIVRSGVQTGDYEIVSHGDNPSPISVVRDSAVRRGTTCVKYYLVTTTGDVACTNAEGKFAALDIPDDILLPALSVSSEKDITVDVIDNFIRSKSEEQAELFRERAIAVLAEEGLSEDKDDDEDESSNEQDSGNGGDEDKQAEGADKQKRAESLLARAIIPGSPLQVVTGDISTLQEVRVRSLSPDPSEKREVQLEDHQELCQVVIGCVSTNEKRGVLSHEHLEHHKNFIDLELDPETEQRFNKREFVFALDIVRNDGSVTTRNFGVMYPSGKQKRKTEYKPWSSWTYWSIGRRDLFPDHKQFTYGSCKVGCGPVAWAMVFGYFDRRSHYSSSYSGSEHLYRTGSDGTTGSPSIIAPKNSQYSSRTRNYIRRLNSILGTFCFFGGGATLSLKMKKVSSFFKARQTKGSPKVIDERHWLLTPLAAYSDKVRSWVKYYVQKRWPVIIGWRAGSYVSWHYPVVTRIRRRTRSYRRKILFWWGKWRTETYYEMFLHMGWGVNSSGTPYGNKWTKLNAYYGVAAVY